jgi:hypothetical protein
MGRETRMTNRTWVAALAGATAALAAAAPADAATTTARVAKPVSAAAATQTPFPLGTLYGGGFLPSSNPALPSVSSPKHPQLVSIRASQDRTQLNFYGDLVPNCSGGPVGAIFSVPASFNVPVNADGTFSGSEPYSTQGPSGRQDGTLTFAGRFKSADVVTGTVRLQTTAQSSGGAPFACDTGTRAFTVRDPRHAPGHGTPKRNARFFGYVSNIGEYGLHFRRSTRTIAYQAYTFGFVDNQCTSGHSRIGTTEFVTTGGRIRKGRFSISGRVTSDAGGGNTVRYKLKLAGRFARARLTGKLTASADFVNAGGQVQDHCAAKLPFWAER